MSCSLDNTVKVRLFIVILSIRSSCESFYLTFFSFFGYRYGLQLKEATWKLHTLTKKKMYKRVILSFGPNLILTTSVNVLIDGCREC